MDLCLYTYVAIYIRMQYWVLPVFYLIYRRPSGEDKEFFVQLFMDPPKDTNVIPNTQSLLHQMFLEQNITFTKVTTV